MITQTKPKRAKIPTLKDVLVGVDTLYRPVKKSVDKAVFDAAAEDSRAFRSAVYEYKQGFIPDVTFVKVVRNEIGLEFHIKIHDVEHEGKKINAWEFYQKFPDKTKSKVKDILSGIYEENEISNVRYEKGSLVIIFTIVLTGGAVAFTEGVAIGATVTGALLAIYNALERKPEIKQKMDELDEKVIKEVKGFIDKTIVTMQKLFGKWFGNWGMGYDPA